MPPPEISQVVYAARAAAEADEQYDPSKDPKRRPTRSKDPGWKLLVRGEVEALPTGCKCHSPRYLHNSIPNHDQHSKGEENPDRRRTSIMTIIHHHSHPCPLVRYECGAFTCNGCGRGGRGSRYRSHNCDFDLHLSCATYTFPCHRHALTYEPRCPQGIQVICDACNTQVCGAHYGCGECNFQVHPSCVQRRIVVPSAPRSCGSCPVYCVYCVRCNPRRRC